MTPVPRGAVTLSTLSQGPVGQDPVVFLHGLVSGNLATWYTSTALPFATNRQVVLFDLRGHGDSTVPATGYDLDSHADDLLAVIDAHVPDRQPVDLVGHSLGALIALRVALAHPARVRRLVLVDAPMPAASWVAPSLVAACQADSPDHWFSHDPALSGAVSGRRRARIQQRLTQLLLHTSLVDDVLAMDAEPDDALRACPRPTLLVYGSDSPCVLAGHHLASRLPAARLTLLPGGHYLPVEAPQRLAAEIRAFLAPASVPAEACHGH